MDKLIGLGMGIPYPYPTHGHPIHPSQLTFQTLEFLWLWKLPLQEWSILTTILSITHGTPNSIYTNDVPLISCFSFFIIQLSTIKIHALFKIKKFNDVVALGKNLSSTLLLSGCWKLTIYPVFFCRITKFSLK